MTSRSSYISSPLFMSKPSSSRSSPPSNLPRASFFIKGDPHPKVQSSSDSSPKFSSDQNVFNVNTGNESLQFHRDSLRDSLQELKQYSHTYLINLDAEHTALLTSIGEVLRILYGTKVLYDLVLSDIRSYFADVTNIKPGTVASFFVGCFNDSTFTGPVGCSPKCVASLQPTEGTPGYYNCEDLVLIYSNSTFNSLNDKHSTHAYIHIEDVSFQGFIPSNIKQLRDAGVEKVSLAYTNPDGSYREITSPLSLDKVPMSAISPSTVDSSDTTPPPSSSGGVAIAIILIILIILLIYFVYQKYYTS